MRSAGKPNIQRGLGAKQSSSTSRRYVCYAPGTGLPRRLQICEILQCERFAVRGGPARNDGL
ncbi:MAG: hypothetical protein LBM98_03220 [Oscillospiraceae bacterium]|nr:hypothetical protein [Oscillospiraceae bacterium]